jgi:signal transduction histidine kinase/ActR/RegA family two-component response regulator
MTLHKLIPFFILVLNLMLLGSALASDRSNPRNRWFAYLSLALGIWSFGVLGLRWSQTPAAALDWEKFVHVGVVAIPILFYRYVQALLGRPGTGPVAMAGFALCLFFFVTLTTPAFIAGVRETPWGYAPVTGPLYGVFFLYFHIYLVIGLVELVRASRQVGSFRRNRVHLVIIGVIVGVLGGVVDFIRFLFGLEWLYPAGIPANGVFAVTLGVAIVRYRLIDLGVMAKRAVLYALALVSVAPLLLAAAELLDDFLRSSTPDRVGDDLPSPALILAILLLLGLPLMRKLEDSLDRVMFRRERAVRDALVALSRETSETLDVDALARALTQGLADRIPVRYAALWAPRRAGEPFRVLSSTASGATGDAAPASLPMALELWLRATGRTLIVDEIGFPAGSQNTERALVASLEADGVALVVPLFLDAELAGILVVGEKLSGEVFSGGEIELLEVLIGRAATALRNARLYEHLRTQMDELRATQHLFTEAREADRAKERFIAMLAHELRNPLAPIVSASHVLERTLKSDEHTTQLVQIVRRQSTRLARLVDDLLDVSRVQSGKITIRAERIDLGDAVAHCLDALAASGKSHGRDLQLVRPAEPLYVDADALRIEQVVWNLLDNALKYTPIEGAIRVVVERDNADAVLRIRDQGVGMTEEALRTVFDLFTQAEQSLDRAEGGLGVGLALVRSLIEQHGGRVTAHSDGLGRGSEFVVRLPVATAERSHEAEPGLRVLLVDANDDARTTLTALLKLAGHRVIAAPDGKAALRLAREVRPDAAIIDIGLPNGDAYELARQIRREPDRRDMHLIALTEYGQLADARYADEPLFDDQLVKPVDVDTLCLRLGEVAGRRLPDTRG